MYIVNVLRVRECEILMSLCHFHTLFQSAKTKQLNHIMKFKNAHLPELVKMRNSGDFLFYTGINHCGLTWTLAISRTNF